MSPITPCQRNLSSVCQSKDCNTLSVLSLPISFCPRSKRRNLPEPVKACTYSDAHAETQAWEKIGAADSMWANSFSHCMSPVKGWSPQADATSGCVPSALSAWLSCCSLGARAFARSAESTPFILHSGLTHFTITMQNSLGQSQQYINWCPYFVGLSLVNATEIKSSWIVHIQTEKILIKWCQNKREKRETSCLCTYHFFLLYSISSQWS